MSFQLASISAAQGEEPQAQPPRATQLEESILKAGSTSHRLLEQFVNTGHQVNFTDEQKCAPVEWYDKLRNAVHAITPLHDFMEISMSIEHISVENKIMELLVKLMVYVSDYMDERERFFREATSWFNITNTIYQTHKLEHPYTAFLFVQNSSADIVRFNDRVRAMATEVAPHRELVESLCSQHLIPELHIRPFHVAPTWRARAAIRSWVAKVRQFEFQCEMLSTQYQVMLVQSLVGQGQYV